MTDDWRPAATAWWSSDAWHAYEAAYGDTPGDRTRILVTATWSTRILDLTPEPAALLRGMRKGRRAEIQVGLRRWRLAEDVDAFAIYAELHRSVHGDPRPAKTYAAQARWCQYRHVVALMDAEAICVASVLFIRSGPWAYYASSAATVPDATATAIWRGILALRASGVRWLELGWQGQATDEKGQNVEKFKRGFGGVDVPVRLP